MEPIILRSLERILDAVMGGVSIYLGYRLFLKLPDKTDSSGKIILPGNISIYLSRVGPGIFFALFGAAVIALSLHHSIVYRVEPSAAQNMQTAQTDQARLVYQGATPGGSVADSAILKERRARLEYLMPWLNSVPGLLVPNLQIEKRHDLEIRLPAVKLTLLESVWGTDWGDFNDFKQWAELGAGGQPPPGSEEPVKLFRLGQSTP